MQILEAQPTAIGTLFSNASVVVTKILELFGTVSTTLLKNEIFQIVIGIVVLGIILGLVFTMIKKLKRKG